MSNLKKSHFDNQLQTKFEELLVKKELLNKQRETRELSDSYALFLEKFKDNNLYEFEFYGRKGKYKPVFTIDSGKIYSACNCSCGRKDQSCRHRTLILLGGDKQFTNPVHISNYKLLIQDFQSAKTSVETNRIEYKIVRNRSRTVRVALSNFFFLFSWFL